MGAANQIDRFYALLGERIRSERQKHNLNQEELSNRLKINRSALANIELGKQKPALHILYMMSGVFALSLSQLLPEIDILNSEESLEIQDTNMSTRLKNDPKAQASLKQFIDSIS